MTRASLFLRLSLPEALWHAHLQRIRTELRTLQPGHIFHIWFHPDNLGDDTDTRLSRVEQVLELLATTREHNGIRSCAMEDLIA